MWIVLSNETLQSSKGSQQHVCYCCRIEEFLMSVRHLSQELHFTTVGNLALLSCNKKNASPEMLHLWEGVEWECQDIDGHTVKVACRIYGQLQGWSLWGITASTVLQKPWIFFGFLTVSLNHRLPPSCRLSCHFLWNCNWNRKLL